MHRKGKSYFRQEKLYFLVELPNFQHKLSWESRHTNSLHKGHFLVVSVSALTMAATDARLHWGYNFPGRGAVTQGFYIHVVIQMWRQQTLQSSSNSRTKTSEPYPLHKKCKPTNLTEKLKSTEMGRKTTKSH